MPWLTLLASPLGRYALAAAAICLAFAAGYLKGHAFADRAALEAELTQARHEQAATARIAQEAAERERQAEAQRIALETEIAAYAEELSKRPDARCALSPADASTLRRLAEPPNPASGSARFR